MEKEIQINGETWFYTVYERNEYDETAFFKTKTKIVTKKKYWFFGEKKEVEVEKYYNDADFVLPLNVEDPSYSKRQILERILKKIEYLNRVEEIKRGEII